MEESRDPDRFERLDRCRVQGFVVPVAETFGSRLLGLAGLSREQAGPGLLIPRCASVHTFGMRFDLDVVFLDRWGEPLAICRRLAPCRLVWQRGASAVLEIPWP